MPGAHLILSLLPSTGMCLQAFAEAFFYLAQKKFKMPPLHAQVASLVDLCEYHLALLDEKRLMRGRSGTAATTGRHPGSNTPSSTQPKVDAKLGPCTGGAHKLATPRHTVP